MFEQVNKQDGRLLPLYSSRKIQDGRPGCCCCRRRWGSRGGVRG